MDKGSIYLDKVYPKIPQILSLLDRNTASSTYGCIDRRYWSWRIGDMPNASIQYGMAVPAWLYRNDTTGIYKNKPIIFEWITAALSFWCSIQHRDGSFDQFFPNERSVGTTYYTLSGALYACESVKDEMDEVSSPRIERAIESSADFINRHEEGYAVISNHVALFAYVCLRLYLRYNEERFLRQYERHIGLILENQSSEGWFLEYDGADPGYQTQCTYYLAECYKLRNDTTLLDALRRGIEDFLVYFFHPDGTFGGEYGSRYTEIVYPAGFEILRDEIPVCRDITSFIYNNLLSGRLLCTDSLDDENLIRLSVNYLRASEFSTAMTKDEDLPYKRPDISKEFREAGIIVRGNRDYYLVFGASRGGVCKVFDKSERRLLYDDNGYFFRTGSRDVLTNQMTQEASYSIDKDTIYSNADFYRVLNDMPTVGINLIIRLLSLTLFRSIKVTDLFRRLLVRRAFTARDRVSMRLKRTIRFLAEGIIIEDDITKAKDIHIDEGLSGRKGFSIKMASSNYYSPKDLAPSNKMKPDIAALQKDNKTTNRIIIARGSVTREPL